MVRSRRVLSFVPDTPKPRDIRPVVGFVRRAEESGLLRDLEWDFRESRQLFDDPPDGVALASSHVHRLGRLALLEHGPHGPYSVSNV